MHPSAHLIGKDFFRLYWREDFRTVLDFGSYDLNGSLRPFVPEGASYIGVDQEAGPGVDVVNTPGRPLPIADGAIDVVVCSSVFEHDPFFWQSFLELVRILKPGGLLYLNVPSNGWFHLHPEDSWRLYPDAGVALVRWARKNGIPLVLMESFVAEQVEDVWNDFVAVFARGDAPLPTEFLHERFPSVNVRKVGEPDRFRVRNKSQDMVLRDELTARIAELERKVVELEAELQRRTEEARVEPVSSSS